jgi:predicted metal-dependent peptidase
MGQLVRRECAGVPVNALALVDKARAGMMLDQPFYASLSLHLELVEDSTCKTMWTDGKKLGFNPAFVESLTPSERRAVVAHEVAHCARLHHVRRESRDADDWNKACDYSINGELKAAGFNLPKGALINPAFDPLSEEEIYARLKAAKRQPQNAQQGGTQGKQSSGSVGAPQPAGKPDNTPPGGEVMPGEAMGEIRDAAQGGDAAAMTASETDWRVNVRQALAVAKAHNEGKLPGYLEAVDAVTAAPRVDWRQELRAFIDQSTVKDYSWMKPNRRFIGAGLILPGKVSDSLAHLIIAIDDSSSIDQDAFTACMSEARAALDEGAADLITVIFCNVSVHRVETFERGDSIEITARGNGGTRFSPVFEWIGDNAPDASAVIYLTDLDCSDFGNEPAAPVIWAAYGERATIAHRAAKVPFGEVLHLAA